jgi:nucleotide-binding universal stress UspA family protein
MSGIVVGYDGTSGAHAALLEAATLARDLDVPLVLVFSYAAPRAGGEAADLDAAIDEHARSVLEHGRSRVEHLGVTVELRHRQQDPAEGLIAVGKEIDARMIVIGSTGERPLKGVLIGSTPYRLVHLADRPVLVVRAHE